MIEGSLEVKLPTIWTDEEQRWEESEKRTEEVRKSREEKKKEDEKRESLRRKKIQVCEKVGKSRNTVFFQWFVALVGRKVGSLKRRVRSHVARWLIKNCTPLWRKSHFEVKVKKTHGFRALLEVEMSKKCTPWWREAHFEVKSARNCWVRSAFGSSDMLSRGRRKGLCTLSKVSKTWGICSISKNDGRHGTFEEDLQRFISVAGAVQKTCSW